MRNTMLMLLMMLAVGIFASAQGRDTQIMKTQVVDAVQTQQSYLVLAKSGTRQQKDTSQECLMIPDRELSQRQTSEQDTRTMKGLVF
jgi:hypothetical protein